VCKKSHNGAGRKGDGVFSEKRAGWKKKKRVKADYKCLAREGGGKRRVGAPHWEEFAEDSTMGLLSSHPRKKKGGEGIPFEPPGGMGRKQNTTDARDRRFGFVCSNG